MNARERTERRNAIRSARHTKRVDVAWRPGNLWAYETFSAPGATQDAVSEFGKIECITPVFNTLYIGCCPLYIACQALPSQVEHATPSLTMSGDVYAVLAERVGETSNFITNLTPPLHNYRCIIHLSA